jgi:2-dehydro-3-deoxygalactonokinase
MIAIDWGTTSLRAFLLDARGAIIDQRRAALGIVACQGRFATVLAEQVAGWDDAIIVLAGMIGSRQGWVEVPYVDCPVEPATVAAGMLRVPATDLPNREVWIVPGLCQPDGQGAPEVMRGEEAQIFGLLSQLEPGRHVVCLPGTHCKWVSVDGQRIETFFTAMTGEVFQLLSEHSLLGRMMNREAPHDPIAFKEGVARARQPGGLLHHLFGVRTRTLLGTLTDDQSSSYLSGILLGHEILNAPVASLAKVQLIGAPLLLPAYSQALHEFGVAAQTHAEGLAAQGIYRLACQRGLIDTTTTPPRPAL